MFYEIIELQEFSGFKCTIYTVIPKGNTVSLFREFLDENNLNHPDEVTELQKRLFQMGHYYGAREAYFTLYEGKPGDHVCALYDIPQKNLRLYCIRYGMNVIILGGGGPKPKDIISWQDDPQLTAKVTQMIGLARDIGDRLVKRDNLKWSVNDMILEGDLKNYSDDED